MNFRTMMVGAASLLAVAAQPAAAQTTTLTIGTVNNSDMIRMQGLTDVFEKQHPDIKINWVTLEENILRQRVTTDIATKGGQFDIMTIGTYEVPIWAKNNWLAPLNFDDSYDVGDLLPPIRNALTVDGKLYAAPFYGESVMTLYRKDLFQKAGLEMPEHPTWDFIAKAAEATADKSIRRLRHLPARQAGLGREHGLPRQHGPRVRRQLLRRRLEAAVRERRLEEGGQPLRRPDDQVRTSGGRLERLQREPVAVRPGQVRHVDRRARSLRPSSPIPSRARCRTRSASRRRPAASRTARTTATTGCGRGRWRSRLPRRSRMPRRPSSPGRRRRTICDLVAQKEGWANVPPGTRTSLYNNDK